MQNEETPSRATQEEDRWPWMNDVPDEDNLGEENEVERGKSTSARRRSSTLARESMLERRFNELISAIHSMMGSITTMQKQMKAINKFVGGQEVQERPVIPPHPILDEEEEPREEDKMERESSLRRSCSVIDRGSIHHGSMGCKQRTYLRNHSHKASQGTNPLLGRFLEEDVGKILEQLIIPKLSKPMFAKKSANEAKSRITNPLELNQTF